MPLLIVMAVGTPTAGVMVTEVVLITEEQFADAGIIV